MEYLRAVFWFARVEYGGGLVGIVVVDGGRGELMTVPKGANAEGVKGWGWTVSLGAVIVGAMMM